jgi:DNA-binding transcriptional LysR family regulator
VDLRQLRYFVAVTEESGFRAASRELYVTQPALSRALRDLELLLGVQLLDRTPQGVQPTDAGREFLVYARAILAQAEAAESAMRNRASRRSGVRIGVVAGILGAGELTAPILHEFQAAREDLDVGLEDLSFCDQVSPLLNGQLDAALVRGPLEHPELDVVPIAQERRMLLVGADHELAAEEVVSIGDVLDQPTLPLGAPPEWSAFWQLDGQRGAPHPHPEVSPTTTIANMQLAVASSNAVISVPGAMSRLAPNALVRCVGLQGTELSMIAVARRRRDERREVTDFIDHAGRTTERLIGLLPGGALPS